MTPSTERAEPDERGAEPGARQREGDPVVRMRGVAVTYPGAVRASLTDVDLDIDRHEVIAILGANGAGKSTLVQAMLGLVPVTAGTYELYGRPVGQRLRLLGYVPQRQTVGGGVPATVEEIVASGRLLRRRLLPPVLPRRDRAYVRDAIETVGLADQRSRPVHTLSGGQQRRVLIARALAGEADALVMDEPFAGVDVANQEILSTTLRALADAGTTLIVVTHEIGPLAGLVRRTVVVDHGRIRYDGPPTARVLTTYGGADPDPHPHPHEPSDPPAAGLETPAGLESGDWHAPGDWHPSADRDATADRDGRRDRRGRS